MSLLPEGLQEPVSRILSRAGDSTPIRSVRVLSGGCINHASRLETGKRSYFLKWNSNSLPQMFDCEARGLQLLAKTNTVPVPRVIGYAELEESHPACILLEWLENEGFGDPANLGAQLAELHRTTTRLSGGFYGLNHDNYIGASRQINQESESWPTFFAESRLVPQIQLAQRNGRLDATRRARLERLVIKIPDLLAGVPARPSLIHGDLWSGNVVNSRNGLALIDPAVSFSDREAEIAFTELFGGFDRRFYAAYQAAWPLEPGYPERCDLYNLYHLLNHLNLFGEGYGYQVDMILSRFVA